MVGSIQLLSLMAKFSPGVGEVLKGLSQMMDILLVDNWVMGMTWTT